MNPLAQQFLGSLIRWGLTALSVYAVQHGLFTENEVARYVEAAALGAPPLIWSLVQKYRGRRKLVVAVAESKFESEQELEDHILNAISAGVSLPSTTTPKDVAPVAGGSHA